MDTGLGVCHLWKRLIDARVADLTCGTSDLQPRLDEIGSDAIRNGGRVGKKIEGMREVFDPLREEG